MNWAVFQNYRLPILAILVGAVCIFAGILIITFSDIFVSSSEVLVLENSGSGAAGDSFITIDVSGAVERPGVYVLPSGSRVIDALDSAGGINRLADKTYIDTVINKASALNDGQKIYIPKQSQELSANISHADQSVSANLYSFNKALVNVNTSTLADLDKLPGIGPVYAQKIIDQRPYSTKEELLLKGSVNESLYNKIKDLVTVY